MRSNSIRSLAAAAAVTALCAPAAHAQWVSLTNSGTPILSTVNPKFDVDPQPAKCTNTNAAPTETVQTQSDTLGTGKFGGLPGSAALPGYLQYRTAMQSLTINGATVGTLYDRVYCTASGGSCNKTQPFIFATRAILNTTVWNPSGFSFEINDFFRAMPTTATVQAGYYMGVAGGTAPDNSQAFKYLEYAGRTQKGIGQTIARDNGFVAFRADTNANDPDRCEPYSRNSSNSPWVYARLTCPGNEVSLSPASLKIKVREGGEELQDIATIVVPGFVCQ